MDLDPLIKIIFVGEQKVGKTCLLTQYCDSRFEANYEPTFTIELFAATMTTMSGKKVRLQIWDTTSQDAFYPVILTYMQGAQGCVIVSDIQDQKTLWETLKWKNLVEQENAGGIDGKSIPIMLVQNKCETIVDGEEEVQSFQKPQYLEDFAKKYGFLGSVQADAKTKCGLDEIFQKLIQEVVDRGLVKEQPIFKKKVFQSYYMIAAVIVILLGYLMTRYLQ